MSVAWFLPIVFIALSSFVLVALGRQILRRELVLLKEKKRHAFASPESSLLMAITLLIGTKYFTSLAFTTETNTLPELPSGWVEAFGACCAIYLAAKAIRALRTPHESGA